MNTLARPGYSSSVSEEMGKKKSNDAPKPIRYHQMSVRVEKTDYDCLEKTARELGLDAAGLLRMILKKGLPEWVQKAAEFKR